MKGCRRGLPPHTDFAHPFNCDIKTSFIGQRMAAVWNSSLGNCKYYLASSLWCFTTVWFLMIQSVFCLFLLHSQLFIWQAHNALFMIRCLLKVFIREMSEEELHQQFSYQERAPGSCGGERSCWVHRKWTCAFTHTYTHLTWGASTPVFCFGFFF